MPPSRRSGYQHGAERNPRGTPRQVEAEEEALAGRSAVERRPPLTAAGAGQAALRYIVDLTARDPEGVTLVEPVEHGWVVDVEVVEDRRIPSSSDILAIYQAEMDDEGNLRSYRRTRRYRRGTDEYAEGLR